MLKEINTTNADFSALRDYIHYVTEVIGVPSGSVGEAMYVAKVHLDMVDLLCWTVVIVAASLLFEKLFLALMRALFRGLERI